MIGSWGYGGYGAFPMVLWFLILIALIFGIILRVGCKYGGTSARRSGALDEIEKRSSGM